MGTKRKTEDWPFLKQAKRGVLPFTAGPWARVADRGDDEFSSAPLTIDGYLPGAETYTPLGEVRIIRSRSRKDANGRSLLSRSFRAVFVPRESTAEFELGVGHCATWEDAVEATAFFDIAKHVKAHGETIYGRPSEWRPMRPFKVVWPWTDPREPNRFYSEFKLLGDWKLDEGREVIALSYANTTHDSRQLAIKVEANAYLAPHPDNPLEWVVYHRNYMRDFDTINIDDFYARLIAGSGDSD